MHRRRWHGIRITCACDDLRHARIHKITPCAHGVALARPRRSRAAALSSSPERPCHWPGQIACGGLPEKSQKHGAVHRTLHPAEERTPNGTKDRITAGA